MTAISARLTRRVHYIHNNPVVANLVATPPDYRWSSARWYRDGPGDRDWRPVIDMPDW